MQNEVEIMQLRRDTIGTLAVKLCSHTGPIGRDNIESTKTSRWESAMLQVCHKVTNPEYQQNSTQVRQIQRGTCGPPNAQIGQLSN